MGRWCRSCSSSSSSSSSTALGLGLVCVAAAILAAAQLAEAAVPASAAVLQGSDVPAGECRIRFPNTCLCRQGSCAGCEHCAGCPDHLCVGLPLGSDTVAELQMDDTSAATDPTKNVAGRSLKVAVASVSTAAVPAAGTRAIEGVPDSISGKVPIPGYRVAPIRKTNTIVRTLDDSAGLICDGTIRNLTLPLSPYGTEPPYAVYTLTGLDMSCDREAGGPCGSQERVQCLPYSDNIGPITQSGEYSLFIRPDNPLVFKITNQSIFLTHMTWTVYDVGTGGAKLVASYGGSGQAPVEVTHEWQPNGPQPGIDLNGDGITTYYCGACTDCNVGDGIQNMTADAGEGLGFTSFELSQLYEDVRCGATCFDLDASYWTGMEYACVTPTCADTDLTTPGLQAFACTPDDMFVVNPLAGANSTLTAESCCLMKTCSNTKPDEAQSTNVTTPYPCPDGYVYNMGTNNISPPTRDGCCIAFTPTCGQQDPMVLDSPFNCTAFDLSYNYSAADLPATYPLGFEMCCVKFTPTCGDQDPGPAVVPFDCEALGFLYNETQADEPAVFPVGFLTCCYSTIIIKEIDVGVTKEVVGPTSGTVGSTVFTFRVTVSPYALDPVPNVMLTDSVPQGLSVTAVSEEPDESACQWVPEQNQVLCNWPVLEVAQDRVVTIQVIPLRSGTFTNTAVVFQEDDSDPSNNEDQATVIATSSVDNGQFTPTCGDQDPSRLLVVRFDCEALGFTFNPSSSDLPAQFPQDFLTCCDSGSEDVQAPDAYVLLKAANPSGSLTVGNEATVAVTVGLNSLSSATQVHVTGKFPKGLKILSIADGASDCKVLVGSPGHRFVCTWPDLHTTDVKHIRVKTLVLRAGAHIISATVFMQEKDATPLDNTAQVQIDAQGACCTSTPSSIDCWDTVPNNCNRGKLFMGKACKDSPCGHREPLPLPRVGACCNRQTGSCEADVEESDCVGQWAAGAQCRADGFCTGACCETSTGKCEQTLKDDCEYKWSIYQECSPDVCPTACIPTWYQCQPPKNGQPDSCCPGSSCQFTYKGCPSGEYVCKPDVDCVPEGYPCGGPNGYCCKGSTCVWDHKHGGICRSSGGCVQEGGFCGKKGFCCRGSYNNGGRCQAVDYNSCYKKCKNYECYQERRNSCNVLHATAASM